MRNLLTLALGSPGETCGWASYQKARTAYIAGNDQALEEFPEPVAGVNLSAADFAAMHEALDTWSEAADGPSPDAEHAAALNLAYHLTWLLARLGHPHAQDAEQKTAQ